MNDVIENPVSDRDDFNDEEVDLHPETRIDADAGLDPLFITGIGAGTRVQSLQQETPDSG